MSANLDFVRSIYAPWERGDFFSSADWAHPEIEFVIADGPQPGSWTGLAGMAKGFREFLGAWTDARLVAEEFRPLDNERVLVLVSGTGRAKISGVELGQIHPNGANVVHVRDGKVTRFAIYHERERALAELGLSSEAGSSPS